MQPIVDFEQKCNKILLMALMHFCTFLVNRFSTPVKGGLSFKVNNHPVNKRQSIDYEDYDDRSSSGSGRRRENLDKTINKLLESTEWL